MRISSIQIRNFKNFEDLSLDLDNINVFIGQCSSGKSNLFEVFQFLKDISSDFKKAINKHGGSYIQNINSQNEPTYLKISFDNKYYENFSFALGDFELDIPEDTVLRLDFKEISYEISFNLNEFDYEILNETVEYQFDICQSIGDNKQAESIEGNEKAESIGGNKQAESIDDNEKGESIADNKKEDISSFSKISENKLTIKNDKGDFYAQLENEEFFKIGNLIHVSLLNMAKNNFINNNIPLINSPLASAPVPWALLFEDLKFYDFIPKFCKSFSEVNGDNYLLPYGQNLSVSLSNVLKDENNQRKFINLLKDLLPDIEKISVEVIQDMYFFSILERFSDHNLPSPLVSDGNGNIIALILALYFEKANSIFFEEPERNIHPALFLNIVQMFKEASLNKQIFITTHSPEILRNVDLGNVFFISKDDRGISTVSKPIDNDVLMPLIEDLGIDEIFVDNYLDIK